MDAWGTQSAYPAILALLERREAGDASSEQVALALGFIESFVVRRMLNGVHSSNLNRIFQSLTGEIVRADDVGQATRAALSGRRLDWPTDDEIREAFRAKPFYWTGRHPQRFFVLRRLEESFPSQERVDLENTKLTIEHVLPQTLTEEWLRMVAEDAPDGEDPTDVSSRRMHTIGNLTLSGYNPELSNSPFSVKRDLLAKSNIEMNRPIAAMERW